MRISDWSSDVCSSDLYFLAGFTRGEEKVWAECAAAELIDRPAIIEQMIERQPALRLAFLLDDLVTSLMEHEVRTHLRPRDWALSVLEWVEDGCPANFLSTDRTRTHLNSSQ